MLRVIVYRNLKDNRHIRLLFAIEIIEWIRIQNRTFESHYFFFAERFFTIE